MIQICADCVYRLGDCGACFHPASYLGPSKVHRPVVDSNFYNSDEWLTCHQMRAATGACGPSGQLFEQAPGLGSFFKGLRECLFGRRHAS